MNNFIQGLPQGLGVAERYSYQSFYEDNQTCLFQRWDSRHYTIDDAMPSSVDVVARESLPARAVVRAAIDCDFIIPAVQNAIQRRGCEASASWTIERDESIVTPTRSKVKLRTLLSRAPWQQHHSRQRQQQESNGSPLYLDRS